MFSISKSRYTPLVQFFFLVINGVGLLVGTIYNSQTADLYPNNSHHKAGWAITWIASAWVVMSVTNLYAGVNKKSPSKRPPLTSAAIAQYQPYRDASLHEYRWSGDSGQGTEPNTASLEGTPRTMSQQSEALHFSEMRSPFKRIEARDDSETDEDEESIDDEKRGFLRNTRVDRLLKRHIPKYAVGRVWMVMRGIFHALERSLLVLGFVGFTTGMVTYGGVFVSISFSVPVKITISLIGK